MGRMIYLFIFKLWGVRGLKMVGLKKGLIGLVYCHFQVNWGCAITGLAGWRVEHHVFPAAVYVDLV